MNLLSEDKFKILKENEEFILSVTDKGFGKEVQLLNTGKQIEEGWNCKYAIRRKKRR